jgi:hypothetical protein
MMLLVLDSFVTHTAAALRVVFIINLTGASTRTIFPFAGALVAIDILLDNTFIVACASPSAIIDISAVYSSFSDARARV